MKSNGLLCDPKCCGGQHVESNGVWPKIQNDTLHCLKRCVTFAIPKTAIIIMSSANSDVKPVLYSTMLCSLVARVYKIHGPTIYILIEGASKFDTNQSNLPSPFLLDIRSHNISRLLAECWITGLEASTDGMMFLEVGSVKSLHQQVDGLSLQ